MKKVVAVGIAAGFMLCGCAATVAPAPDTLSRYNGKPFATIAHPTNLSFTTAGSVAFYGGALGQLLGVDGRALAKSEGLGDPSEVIADRMSASLSARMGSSAPRPLPEDTSSDAARMARAAGGQGVILDVQSLNWEIIYFPFDWTHYQLRYSGLARLVDGETGKMMSQVRCDFGTGDEPNPPSYDELVADKAAWMRGKLAAVADRCQAEYEARLLPK